MVALLLSNATVEAERLALFGKMQTAHFPVPPQYNRVVKNPFLTGSASTAGTSAQEEWSSKAWRAERVALLEVVSNYSFKALRRLLNKEKRQLEIKGSGFLGRMEWPARISRDAEAKLLAIAENMRNFFWP